MALESHIAIIPNLRPLRSGFEQQNQHELPDKKQGTIGVTSIQGTFICKVSRRKALRSSRISLSYDRRKLD